MLDSCLGVGIPSPTGQAGRHITAAVAVESTEDLFLTGTGVFCRSIYPDCSGIVDRISKTVIPSDKALDGGNLRSSKVALAVVGIGDCHGVGQRFIQTVTGNGTDNRLLGSFPHDLGRSLADILEIDRKGCCHTAYRSIGGKSRGLEITLGVCRNRYRRTVYCIGTTVKSVYDLCN